jgi:hypothetical protein
MTLGNSYWDHTGKYEAVVEALNGLIPSVGEVVNPRKNRQLEKFRKASNCYYDLYNNGLMNHAAAFAKVFRIPSSQYKMGSRFSAYKPMFEYHFYEMVEEEMDKIVIAAAVEQKIINMAEFA